MSQYKVFFKDGGSTLVEADDFTLLLPQDDAKRVIFDMENENKAIFNWSEIAGFQEIY